MPFLRTRLLACSSRQPCVPKTARDSPLLEATARNARERFQELECHVASRPSSRTTRTTYETEHECEKAGSALVRAGRHESALYVRKRRPSPGPEATEPVTRRTGPPLV